MANDTVFQRRAIPSESDFTVREEDGRRYIEGYFAVFGDRYDLWDGGYETVDPGAFDLDRDRDIRCLSDHDTLRVLGRTTAGTLTLRVDDRGLWGRVEINPQDQDAVNTWARVQRRDVTQCSFGFDILDQEMIRDVVGGKKTTAWHIKAVKLYEVSVVTFPAYPATEVQARRAEAAAARQREIEIWRAAMLGRLKGA